MIPKELIRQHAYQIYCESGRIEGRDTENWLQAETELNQLFAIGQSGKLYVADMSQHAVEDVQRNFVLPANKPPKTDRPPQLPGETFEAYRERLKPKGWRLWICKLIWKIPQT